MSTSHPPLEPPPPAWAWKLPMEYDHVGKLLPQLHPHRRQHLPPEGNCDRELLFEKPLTPSDVGKLNRLVIPKQHAEKHFPLDGDCSDKGLLLSFEDESGKAWQFRYSYWTSSQSYVLTKGWSRFVKEKQLDAGDIVLFERRRCNGAGRLYIGWKRRGEPARMEDRGSAHTAANGAATVQYWNPVYYAAAPSPPQHSRSPADPYSSYTVAARQGPPLDAGEAEAERAATAPPSAGNSSSRRLRLFGVNLECGPEEEPESHNRVGNSSSWCSEGDGEGDGGGDWVQFMHSGSSGSQWRS